MKIEMRAGELRMLTHGLPRFDCLIAQNLRGGDSLLEELALLVFLDVRTGAEIRELVRRFAN
jgi:hypothetical protein